MSPLDSLARGGFTPALKREGPGLGVRGEAVIA